MLIGIPGSGKTTFAKTLSATLKCDIASTDKVRKDNPKWKEEQVWSEVYRLCAEALKDGKDIIFDATNITPKVRERFVSEVEKNGVKMDVFSPYDYSVAYGRKPIADYYIDDRAMFDKEPDWYEIENFFMGGKIENAF